MAKWLKGSFYIVVYLFFYPVSGQGASILMEGDNPIRWPSNSVSLEVHSGGSDDLAWNTTSRIIDEAMAQWNGTSCSAMQLSRASNTTQMGTVVVEGGVDGSNRLVWIEDETWPFSQFVLAMTMPVWDQSGSIVEADIAFNGKDVVWAEGNEDEAEDLPSVMVHELGHFIGLQHMLGAENLHDPPSMAVSVDAALRSRELLGDDESGACFLYPAIAYTCNHPCDCPFVLGETQAGEEMYTGQLECSNNACETVVEAYLQKGGLGDACGRTLDCRADLECVNTPVGGYCASVCQPEEAVCDPGFSCLETEQGYGVCISENTQSTGGSNKGACLAGNSWSDETQWGVYDSGCGCSGAPNSLLYLALLGFLIGLRWLRE